VSSRDHRPYSRLIPLLVAVLGIAVCAGGIALLRPFAGRSPAQLAASAAAIAERRGASPAAPLSNRAIYARVEPSVVDVTAVLRYDDETASGTGFVIDASAAFVLTNNHVIRDATSVTVTIPGTGHSFPARIVGADVPADVAVLQIGPGPGLTSAPLGDSADVSVGTAVIAIGNQAGADASPVLAPGVISGTGRTIDAADGSSGFSEILRGMLATTARIEPGDSGGPLADSAGVVIGMDTAAGTDGAAPGYAIPINAALAAARQIAAGQPGPGIVLGIGGFLGAIVGSTTAPSPQAQAAQQKSLQPASAGSPARPGCLPTEAAPPVPAVVAPAPAGALVDAVLCGSPAAMAGIVAGDVITSADGRSVSSPDALTAIVSGCDPDSMIPVTWMSTAGAMRTAQVRLGSAPAALSAGHRPCGHIRRRPAVAILEPPLAGLQRVFRFKRLTRGQRLDERGRRRVRHHVR
jgi:S1-C subfamily serine protease